MKPNRFSSLLTLLALLFAISLTAAIHGDRGLAHGRYLEQLDQEGISATSNVSLQLENYASGLNRPVGIASAGDMRLFIVEQAGQIRIVHQDGAVQTTPFLDIRGRVDDSDSEEGLLGLAFHPRYQENGLFYVNYTNTTAGIRRTRISRFAVSADPNIADAASEQILLTVDQPHWNHNAGKILFGPDGYLYIPLGDGGGSNDNLGNNAQNNGVILGKINRIDVNSGPGLAPDCKGLGSGNYTVPASNPFVDGPGLDCDEIWASGLRNPWQSAFDSLTGDLFIADVGQNMVEEVNFQPMSSAGGENYGWRCYEGSVANITAGCSPPGAYTFPIFEYTHDFPAADNCSVTGGYIYRGSHFPALYGRYFLTDYCSGRFWDLVQLPDDSWQSTAHENIFPPGENPTVGNSAFGQRCDGELFMANVELGKVYQLTGTATADPNLDVSQISRLQQTEAWAYLPLVSVLPC